MVMNSKKLFYGVMALVMAISAGGVLGFSSMNSGQVKANNIQPLNPVYHAETDTTDWGYVYFGEYPQREITGDALTEDIINAVYDVNSDAVVNGERYRKVTPASANYSTSVITGTFYNWKDKDAAYFIYEPIKWRVLQNDGESLFLLADSVLDCVQYQRDDKAVTWAISNMRNWLNGYTPYEGQGFNFLSTAFSQEEQQAIQTTVVEDSGNVLHGTSGGNATKDKAFLLSIKEATSTKYGFPADFMEYSASRRMKPSGYAYAMGVWMSTYNEKYDGNCWWLLRSPGSYAQTVSMVYRTGSVYQDGYYAETRYYGVCPAIKVDADSDLWYGVEPYRTLGMDTSGALVQDSLVYGDLDGDNEVTLEDVRNILKIALTIDTQEDPEKRTAADVDGNDDITLDDVNLVLKKALTIIDRFPVEDLVPASPEPTQTPTATPITIPTATVAPTPIPTVEPPVQTHYDPTGRVWIAADSIAAVHGKSGEQPVYGWGELLADYFQEGFILKNTALSSRSTKSFTSESNYMQIKQNMQPGDYLLVSFGHNDERPALELYTDPYGASDVRGSFRWFLKNYYIDPAVRAGVTPVLISPVVRRYFQNGSLVKPLHTPYAEAMKELKEEYLQQGIHIYYIDLHYRMMFLYQNLGEEGTIPLHGRSSGISDNTHLSEAGARTVCEYIVEEMQNQNMDISTFIAND